VIIRNVNGRTDNKTAKGKERKRPTMIFKTLRRKLKIEQHVKELKCSGRVNSSCSTGGTRRVTFDWMDGTLWKVYDTYCYCNIYDEVR
jgi:hypothetical protein